MDSLELFKKADGLLKNERYEEAAAMYFDILERDKSYEAFCKYRLAAVSNITGDPETAYALYYEAFITKPDITSYLYDKSHTSYSYIFKGKKTELETAACPLCGNTALQPKWCYPLPEAAGYNSYFNPVRLWVYCEPCHHIAAREFPEKLFLHNDSLRAPNSLFFSYYGEVLDRLSRYTEGTALFEVGIGACECLLAAREIGYEACGIDVIDRHVVMAREKYGLNAETSDFLDYETDEMFDIIIMGDVIEHVSDPILALNKAHELLSDGGALWVSTPNFDSAYAIVAGHYDPMTRQQYHLNYFSKHSFYVLLEQCGFMPVDYCISSHYNGSMEVTAVKI